MESSAQLKQIEEFWNANLCGKQFVDNTKYPSKEYFQQYTIFRYRKTHHLDRYIDWSSAKGKSVLEIGLGLGADGACWARHASSYTGLDLTREAVEATRIHFEHLGLKGETVQGNAEQMPFNDENFDIVYSHGVLHHTSDIDKAFREVRRVLKPGGLFIVMLYSKSSFNYWIRIQFYFRLRFLFEIFKNSIGLTSRGNWALHHKNFKKDGWNYLSWKNFPHHCTDGPDCYVANIYYLSEMKKMLLRSGFKIVNHKKAHFPLGGQFPVFERFLASFIGFHQIVWAVKD